MNEFEDLPLTERLQWHIDYLKGPGWVMVRDTLRVALELAKRVEAAPIGSLTDEGRDWVFYSESEPSAVEKIIDKRVAIVLIDEDIQ